MKKYLFLILLFAGLVSCSDKNDDELPTPVKRKRIVRMEDSPKLGGRVVQYKYKDGRLDVMLLHTAPYLPEDVIGYMYTYDRAGRLVSEIKTDVHSKKKISEVKFNYISSKMISVEEFDSEGALKSTITLDLNEKGLLIRKNLGTEFYFVYQYDEYENLKEAYGYKSGYATPLASSIYKYDDKHSYSSNQGLPKWYWVYRNFSFGYFGKNNIVQLEINRSLPSSYKYDYDEDDYPTTVYDKNKNNDIMSVFTYEVIE